MGFFFFFWYWLPHDTFSSSLISFGEQKLELNLLRHFCEHWGIQGVAWLSWFLDADNLMEELKHSSKCTTYSVENASICNELDAPNGSFISLSNAECVTDWCFIGKTN